MPYVLPISYPLPEYFGSSLFAMSAAKITRRGFFKSFIFSTNSTLGVCLAVYIEEIAQEFTTNT